MALGKKLKEARLAAGMSQRELAERIGMTQAAVAALEKRDSKQSTKVLELASALSVSVAWLLSGENPKELKNTREGAPGFSGHVDAWEGQAPLAEGEVELPLFREIELSAGSGVTQVEEYSGAKLRFAKSNLYRADVPPESAALVFVHGHSMEPILPDGTCVGVNTADKVIREGEIYAIDHGGMLRVKYLHPRPGGGVKIVSQNTLRYPVEELKAEQVASKLTIIGRVFWWSVLRLKGASIT